jgi:hypothetical protein
MEGVVINWTEWPLLEVDVAELPGEEARATVGGALAQALDRGQVFAAVVRMPATAERGDRGRGAAGQARLIRQLRPGLARQCRGLAFVLPLEVLDEHAKVIQSGPKIWGCPITAVTDVDRARTWARDQLVTGAA